MAPGRKALRRFIFGEEATPGNGGAATMHTWRGPAMLVEDGREVTHVDEHIGIIGGADRSYIAVTTGKISLPETEVTFEQFPHLLRNAFGGATTGVADGVGTGRIYTTTIPTTASPTDYSWMVEGGDDAGREAARYAKIVKITLTGASNQPLKVSADLICGTVSRQAGAFSATVALPVVEEALFNLGRVALDAVGGAYGTTQVARQVHGLKVEITPKWIPLGTADETLSYSQVAYAGHEISGEVTFLHDDGVAGAAGEKANWRAQTPRLLQLRFDGSTLATAGTTYQKKALIVNLPIKWKTFSTLGDSDDIDTVTGTFLSRYNATVGNAGSIIVVNALASLAAA